MKLGIVGLPNVGKSTLFNALSNSHIEAANYPFCTIEPNTGIVPVPDARLHRLAEMYHPKKETPAVIEFVDIAGLVKGASKGEGLGNKFLSHIREVDAIIHVVRCFDNENIVHVEGSTNPARDTEIINMELTLSDIDLVDRRIDKSVKAAKADKKFLTEVDLFTRLKEHLNEGLPARTFDCSDDERAVINTVPLLSAKPVIYAANMDEDGITDYENVPYYQQLKAIAEKENAEVIPVCAKIEEEIDDLPPEEQAEFLAEMGIPSSGLDRLVTASYRLLGLISFLTAGEDECRAWTIVNGTKAPQAAGKIHTDFERGFIRAEVVSFENLISCGSMVAAKEKGLVASEGKDYVMKDGDVVLFRFNV